MRPVARADTLVTSKKGCPGMRVLLAGMTNLLFQIVAGVVSRTPETEVVGSVDDVENLAAQVRSSGADVLMMPVSDRPDDEAVWPLLYQFPRLKVVVIARNGEGGFVHELRPLVQALHELSTGVLQAVLQRDSAGAMR